MTGGEQETAGRELDRRSLIKRATVTGLAAAWATPTIQSLTSPAFATGSPPGSCVTCLEGSAVLTSSYGSPIRCYGSVVPRVSFTLSPVCCGSQGAVHLQVRVHRQPQAKDLWFNLTKDLAMTCGAPTPAAPGPRAARCPSVLTGTVLSDGGNTLTFTFTDSGNDGLIDSVALRMTRMERGTQREVLSASASVAAGTLQNPGGYGDPLVRVCSGC